MRLNAILSCLVIVLLVIIISPTAVGQGGARWPDKLPGTWEGTWGNEFEHGTFQWVFGTNGHFQGTLHELTTSTPDGTVEGSLDSSGAIPATVTFTYQYPAVGKFSGTGPMILNGTGHLIGIVRLLKADGTHLGDIAIDMTKD